MRVLYIHVHAHTQCTHAPHTCTDIHTYMYTHTTKQQAHGVAKQPHIGRMVVYAYVTNYDTLHNPVQPRVCASITCIHTSVFDTYKIY